MNLIDTKNGDLLSVFQFLGIKLLYATIHGIKKQTIIRRKCLKTLTANNLSSVAVQLFCVEGRVLVLFV